MIGSDFIYLSLVGKLIFNTVLKFTLPDNQKLLQLTVVLVSKRILEKYQFLVVLADKTCIGFKSDNFFT